MVREGKALISGVRRLSGGTLRRQQRLFVWASLIPILAYLGLFSIWPILQALNVSLRRWRFAEPNAHPFTGLANYSWAVHDPVFWTSVSNTLYFLLAHAAFELVMGLILAVILFSWRQPWRGIATTICFIPVITSIVASSLVIGDILAFASGPLNYLLRFVGLGPYAYLTASRPAQLTVIAVTNWRNLGIWVVLYLSGLTTVPSELMEAAAIDGASRVQSFFRITIPLLRPTFTYLIVMCTIGMLQEFTGIFTLTGGGPGTATRTLVLHIYEHAFTFFDMGRGSAIAFVLFLAVLMVSAVQLRVMRHNFEY